MIHLITSFYQHEEDNIKKIDRNKELVETLKKNIESKYIEKIYLYIDSENLILKIKNIDNNGKIKIINIGKQPLYSDLFKYANENLQDKVCMISNSDIYLYECCLECFHKLENNIYALSRYEHDFSCPQITNFQGSHDVFIFNSPVHIKNIEKMEHFQNIWGSENNVIDILVESGNNVLNPCYQIKTIHLHSFNYRNENREQIRAGKNIIRPSYLPTASLNC